MRRAFTLIELMVSISILSIMMIFLYKSYSSLNKSNSFFKKEVLEIESEELKKRVLFLDFSLALSKETEISILNQEKNEDIVFFQSSNSVHCRYNPYIAYIIKESKLYRLEFTEYLLDADSEFSVDYFGEVDGFRVYKSQTQGREQYLIHIDYKDANDIMLKIKVLGS